MHTLSETHLQQQLFEEKRRLTKAEHRFYLDITRRRLAEVRERMDAK